MSKNHLRPKLSTVLLQFVGFLVLVFSVRWFLFEPFTVPSGSMFPNLLINDYILVKKLDVGLRVPMTKYWLTGPHVPPRGKAVVFWSQQSQVYFVKRLVGLPGDVLKIQGNQILSINGQPVVTELAPRVWELLRQDFPVEDARGVTARIENYSALKDMKIKSITLMYSDSPDKEITEITVPENQLFFMGDHRSSSSDSRVWGFVDLEDLVGPVEYILFSCAQKSVSTQFCNPKTIRWNRLFTKAHK